jgi:hypothetical protein
MKKTVTKLVLVHLLVQIINYNRVVDAAVLILEIVLNFPSTGLLLCL